MIRKVTFPTEDERVKLAPINFMEMINEKERGLGGREELKRDAFLSRLLEAAENSLIRSPRGDI